LQGRSSKSTACADKPTGAADNGQAQSRNGSNGQHESERYRKGEFFVAPKQALQDLEDKRIGAVAFAILCDVRSKGDNWQLRIKEVRKRFGWGEQAARTAMRELANAGWVTRKEERGKGGVIRGRHYAVHRRPLTKTRVTQALADPRLIKEGPEERKESVQQSLRKKESLKSKAGARAHAAFSLSALPEDQAKVVQRFNDRFIPKGAQPINKALPSVRQILRHCGWGDYTAFERAALADQTNWLARVKTKRPGFVALWHAYKLSSRSGKQRVVRFADKDIEGLAGWRNELRDESNALFRADKVGSAKRRAEIEKQIEAVEAEWESRTGRSAEELRMKHGAARSQREHEINKAKPIIPWLNGNNELARNEDGYVVIGGSLRSQQ
jgi:hypothetical protein